MSCQAPGINFYDGIKTQHFGPVKAGSGGRPPNYLVHFVLISLSNY